MTGWAATLAALAAAATAALLLPAPPRPVRLGRGRTRRTDPRGWLERHRLLWSCLAGLGAAVFLGGPLGPVAGVAGAAGAWVAIGRAEPPAEARRREALRRDLPHVVHLFATALSSGAAPTEALAVVAAALPGPAAEPLAAVHARLSLGLDPVRVWEGLGSESGLAPLGRAVARAHVTGAPVQRSVERLAEELGRAARSAVEDRARAVGVRAALPLGLCLLPAFLLIGIVPLVAALLSTLVL